MFGFILLVKLIVFRLLSIFMCDWVVLMDVMFVFRLVIVLIILLNFE